MDRVVAVGPYGGDWTVWWRLNRVVMVGPCGGGWTVLRAAVQSAGHRCDARDLIIMRVMRDTTEDHPTDCFPKGMDLNRIVEGAHQSLG